ncbi:MAG: uracil-DNA glycosylase family protein [Myxococcota bacterium]
MLKPITDDLVADLDGLTFGPPVTHVYNPLLYARASWDMYCTMYGQGTREILWVGMNPGPWGMSQVGVPFGEIAHVRDWLGIEAPVGKPEVEHPKRPVEGFACARSEVSGRRLWGWAKDTYGTPEAFFARFFVWNYCPLAFMEEGGRNRIPEKLPRGERQPLFEACDKALRGAIEHFEPKFVIGVGKFAEKRAKRAVKTLGLVGEVAVGSIPHPSPASPLANKGWAKLVAPALAGVGVTL